MKSKTMKVLHPIGGRSMIGHVLHAVQAVEPTSVVAVVGHQREQVGPHITELVPSAVLAVQETQDGTGHAVRVAMEASGTTTGTVIVAAGDTPLLEGESLRAFAEEHHAAQRAVSILSGRLADPFGYGRIVRNHEGDVEAIVEEKDATPEQREIARDQLRHPRLRRGVPGLGAGPHHQRQRQGRVLPHRRRRPGARGRADRRRPPHRRRRPDRGRQRPRPAGRARPRAQPPHRHPLDEGRRDGHGPGDHVDRGRRGARARRHDPPRHAAARRDRRARGRRGRARHDAEGLRGRRRRARRTHPRRARRHRRPAPRSGRSPTSGPARSSG